MKRVLIVEDQFEIRELIRMTLELEPIEIHESHNGADGLTQALELRPQLVLLDVMMPGDMDGFSVCERIRADSRMKKTRIVLLTARNRQEDRDRGMRAGADDYLVKPFSPRHLLAVVDRLT